MFSRFDNMMQHTQTHNRNKRKPAMKTSRRRNSVPSMNNIKREPTIVLNEESKKMKSHNHHPSLPPNMTFITQSSLPPPPPPTSSSTKIHLKSSPPPPIITNNHMIESRTLPPPTRRASFSHFSPYYLPLNLSSSTPTNTAKSPTSTTHLLPDSFDDYKKLSSNYFYSSSTFPNMNLSPTDTFDYQKQSFLYRRGSLSTVSSSNSTISSSNDSQPSFDVPVPLSSSSTSSSSSSSSSFNYGRRRLSAADLQAPIQSLQERYADRHHPMYNGNSPTTTEFNISNPSLSSHPHDSIHPLQNNTSLANNKDTVDISTDEYEALQGFSKFSSQRLPEEKITNIQSPNMSAQVHAFRQKLLPIQESFQRPVRNT